MTSNTYRGRHHFQNAEEATAFCKENLEAALQILGYEYNTGKKKFRCINPAHEDRHPSMMIINGKDGFPHCHCFSCNAHYSTFDVVAMDKGLVDTKAIFRETYSLLDVSIEGYRQEGSQSKNQGRNHKKVKTMISSIQEASAAMDKDSSKGAPMDITAGILAAHESLKQGPADTVQAHYRNRGLSDEIIEQYKLGFVQDMNEVVKDYPDRKLSYNSQLYKFILPYPGDEDGTFCYFVGEIYDRSQCSDRIKKYNYPKGPRPLFNARYLKLAAEDIPEVIFITEGLYDALSIEQMGGHAIALGGTAHADFERLLRLYHPKCSFVLALDNDEAGQAAAKKLEELLKELKYFSVVRTSPEGKDYNECLVQHPELLQPCIWEAEQEVASLAEQKAQEEKTAYEEESAAVALINMLDDFTGPEIRPISTGYDALDGILDGGLYPGLYGWGAITGLGKSQFTTTGIAVNIAKQGHDVLVFALEMSRKETIIRILSRLSLEESVRLYDSMAYAKTSRTLGRCGWGQYGPKDSNVINTAVGDFCSLEGTIYVHEGIGEIGADKIRSEIEKHIRITGRKPVVIVDYLQIMAPFDVHATDKQNTDKNVVELKRMASREFQIPIIAISSFNRENYFNPVSLVSFKESGAIEFTCDVIIGMQKAGMERRAGESDKARQERLQEEAKRDYLRIKEGRHIEVQLVVLKNRHGSCDSVTMCYFPLFGYYCGYEELKPCMKPGGSDFGFAAADDDIPEEFGLPQQSQQHKSLHKLLLDLCEGDEDEAAMEVLRLWDTKDNKHPIDDEVVIGETILKKLTNKGRKTAAQWMDVGTGIIYDMDC